MVVVMMGFTRPWRRGCPQRESAERSMFLFVCLFFCLSVCLLFLCLLVSLFVVCLLVGLFVGFLFVCLLFVFCLFFEHHLKGIMATEVNRTNNIIRDVKKGLMQNK